MNEEIYIYSDSEVANHNFSIYATKTLVDLKQTSVKFLNLLDLARSDLDSFCKNHIGISAFNKTPEHRAIIDKLLNVYAYDIMEDLDEDWWINKLIDQAADMKESIPGLALFCSGINSKKYLDTLKNLHKKVVCITLNNPSDCKNLDIDLVFQIKQQNKITKTEELDEKELDRVSVFLDSINEKYFQDGGQ